jgi:transcription initiation factor TFIIH subunit 3
LLTGTHTALTPASLLTVILDTNPIAWDSLSSLLSLSQALSNLLVFINAHLAINGSNQIAILASHTDRVAWLYPTTTESSSTQHARAAEQNGTAPEENANKYRPFLTIEQEILANLRRLLDSTDPDSLAGTTAAGCTQIAGSLTTALTYINQQTLLVSPPREGMEITLQTTQTAAKTEQKKLISRLLVVSVSSDLADQYISVMNSIFAAQRLQIPVDVLKLAGNTTFLQQASDATDGIYLAPEPEDLKGGAGLLQYLMMGYLPDATSRQYLNLPGKTEVDFRAACFCHRKVVDIGYVCSVCLSSEFSPIIIAYVLSTDTHSVFCDPAFLPNNQCLTCSTLLALPTGWNIKPALIPRKKKKKKITDAVSSGVGTPVSRSGTPAR